MFLFSGDEVIMDRNEKMLLSIDKAMRGLEIGPSFSPIAPKSAGYNVTILDHLCADDLRKMYEGHAGVNPERIEEVDVVWDGSPFGALFAGQAEFDYIIASHVIEHTPDLIGFLNGCASILSPKGVLILAIPDKRYCFDFYRERSGIGSIIDASHRQDNRHSPGTVLEHFFLATAKEGHVVWAAEDPVVNPASLTKVHSLNEALAAFNKVAKTTAYVDVHRWAFTPNQFRLIIYQLNKLGMIKLQESMFFDSSGCEFIIKLNVETPPAPFDPVYVELASLRELNQIPF
jgi:predicted SAM-dependent methyltransferase